MSSEHDARLGTTLGSYRLVSVLGRGGMGVVYLGEHVYLGRRAAVKVLDAQWASSGEAVGRFLREAAAASAIAHPNIVEVLDFGQSPDGSHFLVMEHVQGESVAAVLAREGPLAPRRAVAVAQQVASALAAAHELGIFHRDLKPENVLLARKGGRRRSDAGPTDEQVKLVDFGVARVTRPEVGQEAGIEHETAFAAVSTQADTIFGTPAYMAPEIARGARADARSEVYAAGVLLYEMLTGAPPFTGRSPAEILFKHLADPVIPPSERAPDAGLTADLDRTILRALAKAPDDRQQTMAELLADLEICATSAPVHVLATEAAPLPPPQRAAPVPPPPPAPIRGHTLPLGTTVEHLADFDDEPTES